MGHIAYMGGGAMVMGVGANACSRVEQSVQWGRSPMRILVCPAVSLPLSEPGVHQGVYQMGEV